MKTKLEPATVKLEVAHTPLPWKFTKYWRGNIFSKPKEKEYKPLITTDFHSTGKIQNGPEADICHFAVEEYDNSRACCVNTQFQHIISLEESFANAEYLVRAANQYEPLLQACTVLLNNVPKYLPTSDSGKLYSIAEMNYLEALQVISNIINQKPK